MPMMKYVVNPYVPDISAFVKDSSTQNVLINKPQEVEKPKDDVYTFQPITKNGYFSDIKVKLNCPICTTCNTIWFKRVPIVEEEQQEGTAIC
eukprot:UN07929